MKVEAVYEGAAFVPDPFHTWQNIVDFDGRRYLFHYDRSEGRVYDINYVNAVSVVESSPGQVFDVSDPKAPSIAAYFVPKAYGKETPDYGYGNQTHGVYIEWDRNIIWTFTNHGIYALSAEKLLGKPNLGAPKQPFRTSGL